MGYNTNYKIVSVEPANVAALERAFSLHSVGRDGYRWFGVGIGSGKLKWYEHEKHLADAMIESGVTKLVLHGEGEEPGDVWDKTFGVDEQGCVWVQTTRYELVPGKPEMPKKLETSGPGWLKVAERNRQEEIARDRSPRLARSPGCMSNECAIRNACTGHSSCPRGLGNGE